MKRLIVINYQREIPPFLINDINVAKEYYDSVDYITPTLSDDNSSAVNSNNVSVIQCEIKNKVLNKILAVFMLFRSEILREIFLSIKSKKISVKFLKHMCIYTYASLSIYKNLKNLVERYTKDEVVVLAAWYSVEAYILSKLKKKFPYIKAISFAHSFEIDTKKNMFVGLSLDEYKSKTIDKIVFISKTMQEIYHKSTNYKYVRPEKETIRYLGSIKLFKSNPTTKEDVFQICSCSGAVPVKRIELIIEALKLWDGNKIRWVHLGGGPLLESLRAEASQINNPNVVTEFKGSLTNNEVQSYYSENHLDLFINVSKSEGLPVSIMEACSYGIPCIATDVGGTKEIVDENTGVLINEMISSKELKNVILQFLNKNPDDLLRIRTNCEKFWEEFFDVKKNAFEFYSNL